MSDTPKCPTCGWAGQQGYRVTRYDEENPQGVTCKDSWHKTAAPAAVEGRMMKQLERGSEAYIVIEKDGAHERAVFFSKREADDWRRGNHQGPRAFLVVRGWVEWKHRPAASQQGDTR